MTSAQFYVAIGLPIFSILLVWLGSTVANNRAIAALGQRIDGMGKRLDQRIDDMGKQIEGMNQRIDDLRSEMREGFAAVNARLDRLETRFDRIEDEVRKDHEGRLARLEARVFARTA